MIPLNLHTTRALLILDSDGNRILAKYYSEAQIPPAEQKKFEKTLYEKTKKGGEIVLMDQHVVAYKNNIDVFFYVVGSLEENELILKTVLDVFYNALAASLRTIDKRSLTDNLDVVLLTLDETIDDGILLEASSSTISSRCMRTEETGEGNNSEQSLGAALTGALRQQLERSLR